MKKDQVGIIAAIAFIALLFFGYGAYLFVDKPVSEETATQTQKKQSFDVPELENIKKQYAKKMEAYNQKEHNTPLAQKSIDLNTMFPTRLKTQLKTRMESRLQTQLETELPPAIVDSTGENDRSKAEMERIKGSAESRLKNSAENNSIKKQTSPKSWQELGFVRTANPFKEKNTKSAEVKLSQKDTIMGNAYGFSAYVYGDHLLKTGSKVKLRLNEEVKTQGITISKGSFAYGTASLSEERVMITIRSLVTSNGNPVKVHFSVYDLDGLKGLYAPVLSTQQVAKETANQALSSGGSSLNVPIIGQVGVNLGRKKINEPSVKVGNKYQVTLKPAKP